MKFLARIVPAAALLVILSGCFFDNPLTSGPSKSLNTWLLGVWESKDDKGRVSRIRITPISSDRYALSLATPGKTPQDDRKYEFEAWPSRVGSSLFLSLRCLSSPGDIPTGAYVFTHIQLLDQNHAKARGLQLDATPATSSFELRKEVRRKLKDLSLYENVPTANWTRVAEIFWSTDGADPVFTPIRNPGTIDWEATPKEEASPGR